MFSLLHEGMVLRDYREKYVRIRDFTFLGLYCAQVLWVVNYVAPALWRKKCQHNVRFLIAVF